MLTTSTLLACAALALLLGTLPASATAPTSPGEMSIAGDYVVRVEMLPPASFAGPKASLVLDGGAKPLGLGGSKPPDHRLAVFVTDNSRPVEQATVVILYRSLYTRGVGWASLPVARMHVAGKGLDTTQFGNNVRLGAGMYEVRVSVNGEGAATFRFVLHS